MKEIPGEAIDFASKYAGLNTTVKKQPRRSVLNLPIQTIAIQQAKVTDEGYFEDVRAGFNGTYAEWCGSKLPF